jgi:hypothetical protein
MAQPLSLLLLPPLPRLPPMAATELPLLLHCLMTPPTAAHHVSLLMQLCFLAYALIEIMRCKLYAPCMVQPRACSALRGKHNTRCRRRSGCDPAE